MRAIAIAEQLIRPPLVDDPLAFLATEAGALALIHEAMQALPLTGEALPVSVQPQTTAYLRVVRLRAQIEAGECDGLCLNEIARRAGCNATTLQREFHGVVGKSIDRYRRECSLLRGGSSLAPAGGQCWACRGNCRLRQSGQFFDRLQASFRDLPRSNIGGRDKGSCGGIPC
jgi:hypothetical protein